MLLFDWAVEIECKVYTTWVQRPHSQFLECHCCEVWLETSLVSRLPGLSFSCHSQRQEEKSPRGWGWLKSSPAAGFRLGAGKTSFTEKRNTFWGSNYTLSPAHLVGTLNIWSPWHWTNGSPTLVSRTDFISNKWGPLSLFQIEFPYKKVFQIIHTPIDYLRY